MSRKQSLERVIAALQDSPHKWRTVRGVARDSGLSMHEVVKILARSPDILRSRKPNRHGQALFTTRAKFRERTPLSRRFKAALTNEAE